MRLEFHKEETTDSAPRGCNYNRAKKKAYFNKDVNGKRKEDAQQICKKPGKIDNNI